MEPEVYDTLFSASVVHKDTVWGEVTRTHLCGKVAGDTWVLGLWLLVFKGSGDGTFILICAIDPDTGVNSAV